jgi:hypothetical protein
MASIAAAEESDDGSSDEDSDDEMDDLPADEASDDELDGEASFGLQPAVKARYVLPLTHYLTAAV